MLGAALGHGLEAILWLHLISIEVLMDEDDVVAWELAHKWVGHDGVGSGELWLRVVGCGAGGNVRIRGDSRAIGHVEHLGACVAAHVAHVAGASEGEVVVVAALADPVTSPFIRTSLWFFRDLD